MLNSVLKLVHFKSASLSEVAREVEELEFGESLEDVMSEMAVSMYGHRGVGLAGPQIGDNRRIFVVDLSYVVGQDYGHDLVKMVNPQVVSSSVEEAKAEEGCLSYPGMAVRVSRPVGVHVKYFTPLGDEVSRTFTDWQARVVMHEMDHLDGITLYSRSSSFSRKRYDKKVLKAVKA